MIALLLTIICQIVCESLPISSSGHVFLIQTAFSFYISNNFYKVFDHLLHGPAIIIILIVFWYEWRRPLGRLLWVQPGRASYRMLVRLYLRLVWYGIIVTCITSICYVIFRVWLAHTYTIHIVLLGFVIDMLLLCSLLWVRPVHASLDTKRACVLGLVQGMSLVPGISRFAVTYVAGRWLGISGRRSLQISFLFQFPLLCAAFAHGLYKVMVSHIVVPRMFYNPLVFVVGGLASVGGYYALRMAVDWGVRGVFYRFGFYMMLPILYILFFFR